MARNRLIALAQSIIGGSGTGTTNNVPKFISPTQIGASSITDDSSNVTSTIPFSSPGAGAGSERYGNSAVAAGASSVAVGASASAAGASSVAIGASASAAAQNVVIGASASIGTPIQCVAVGYSASCSGTNSSVAVGSGAAVTGGGGVAVGASANSTGGVAIGVSAALTSGLGVAIGYQVAASGSNCVAVGRAASVAHQSIGLGYQATTTAHNQVVIGSSGLACTDLYLGNGVTAATPSSTIKFHGTGGNGTDIYGSDVSIESGISTGAATANQVLIKTCTPVVSGTGAQVQATRLTISQNPGLVVTGYIQWSGQARTTAQFDKTNNTLANVTGLSVNVVAGRTYTFRAVLHVTNAAGGDKYAISGTATATAIVYSVLATDLSGAGFLGGRTTTLGTGITGGGAATVLTTIEGLITVNAAGTLTVQFAQSSTNGTPSSVLIGSTFVVEDIA